MNPETGDQITWQMFWNGHKGRQQVANYNTKCHQTGINTENCQMIS